jgi:Protein of unknown function (DUF3071)
MQELRFVAVSEDGRYAVLAVPGRSARFTLPIDERLRAVAQGQTSRLAQYEIEVESPLRPKEIQARIRAGETVEEIADAAGIAIERIRWFEGPVLAERAYMADQAQLASVRRPGDAIPSSPGPRLGEIVTERLKVFGADPEDALWDAKKLGDASWRVQLAFISGGRLHTAEWNFDPRRRHVAPADDNAIRMSLPGSEPPQPAAPAPGEATVTHLAPRLTSAGVQGNGVMAGSAVSSGIGNGLSSGLGNGGRTRLDRPVPMRPAAEPRISEPRIAEPQTTEPRATEPRATEPRATEPQVAEPQAPEPREPEAPAAAAPAPSAPAVPSAPPVSPASVAAQVSPAVPSAPPVRFPQAPPASHPGRHAHSAQEQRVTRSHREVQPHREAQPQREAQPHRETPPPPWQTPPGREAEAATATAPPAAAPVAATTPAPAAPAVPAAETPPAAAPAAETPGEQTARQGRKSARGKRSSVPSWDEIMFGNSRQRE